MVGIVFRGVIFINEGKEVVIDFVVKNGIIEKIGIDILVDGYEECNCDGLLLLLGCIDDQVYFCELGFMYKVDIVFEFVVVVVGGIIFFMEMLNIVFNMLMQELLQVKYDWVVEVLFVNYLFFMGVFNDNIGEVLKMDLCNVCGVKIFMGFSIGNMLVDQIVMLEKFFLEVFMLIVMYCEDEVIVCCNLEEYKVWYGEDILMEVYLLICFIEVCYFLFFKVVELVKKYNI